MEENTQTKPPNKQTEQNNNTKKKARKRKTKLNQTLKKINPKETVNICKSYNKC